MFIRLATGYRSQYPIEPEHGLPREQHELRDRRHQAADPRCSNKKFACSSLSPILEVCFHFISLGFIHFGQVKVERLRNKCTDKFSERDRFLASGTVRLHVSSLPATLPGNAIFYRSCALRCARILYSRSNRLKCDLHLNLSISESWIECTEIAHSAHNYRLCKRRL